MPIDVTGQLTAAGSAFLGVLARARHWRRPNGSLDYDLMVTELVAAPCIGLIAYGVGTDWHLSAPMISALAATFGLLGTSAISQLALDIVDRFLYKKDREGERDDG